MNFTVNIYFRIPIFKFLIIIIIKLSKNNNKNIINKNNLNYRNNINNKNILKNMKLNF
jgi:hypothetical protein